MSVDKSELDSIFSLLDKVKDPEIGISITKLGMVGAIEKEGDTIKIRIKLTVPGCPLSSTIEKDIKVILGSAGYQNVELEFSYMTRDELENIKKSIRGENKQLPPPIAKYDKKKIKNIIAVYSAKGGVGKSSVVSLLALAAENFGYKTGVLDCDVSGPSIQTILGTSHMAAVGENNKITPLVYEGIKIISVDMLTNAEALIWRGPLVSSAIKQMYDDADWGDLDVLFLDLPPGTSDGPITVFQSIPVDAILLVTTPQLLSQTVGKKTMLMAETLKVPIIGIIENMSYIICEHCGGKMEIDKKQEIIKGVPVLARLPFKKEWATNLRKNVNGDTISELKGAINVSISKVML